MIVDGLLMLLTELIQAAYEALPEWDITVNFQNAMRVDGMGYSPLTGLVLEAPDGSVFDWILISMWQMNKFIPVDHLVAAFSIIVLFWTSVLAFRGGKWLIGIVRGAGTQ